MLFWILRCFSIVSEVAAEPRYLCVARLSIIIPLFFVAELAEGLAKTQRYPLTMLGKGFSYFAPAELAEGLGKK